MCKTVTYHIFDFHWCHEIDIIMAIFATHCCKLVTVEYRQCTQYNILYNRACVLRDAALWKLLWVIVQRATRVIGGV